MARVRKKILINTEDFRVIQVFLSSHGVFETSISTEADAFHCTCPGWEALHRCKHVAYVQKKIREDGGHYHLEITGATKEEITEAMQDAARFREFVISKSPIVVLN